MGGTKRVWLVACLLASVFATACNGGGGDAISSVASALPSRPDVSFSPSISRPTDEATPSEEPSEEPAPTEEPEPSEEPAPTEEPPTEEPAPTEAPPTEEPTQSEAAAPAPSGQASSGVSPVLWWVLGLLAVAALIVVLVMRSRRRPSATLQQAYAASAAVRDRLGQEVSTSSAAPGTLESLVDEADRVLREAEVAAPDEVTRAAVDQTLRAVDDVRQALALRTATAGAAHASGTDVEAALLRALAAMDAALGPLREVAGGEPPRTTGFET
jgi:hypothetical protein